jgi:hypothetical protein
MPTKGKQAPPPANPPRRIRRNLRVTISDTTRERLERWAEERELPVSRLIDELARYYEEHHR